MPPRKHAATSSSEETSVAAEPDKKGKKMSIARKKAKAEKEAADVPAAGEQFAAAGVPKRARGGTKEATAEVLGKEEEGKLLEAQAEEGEEDEPKPKRKAGAKHKPKAAATERVRYTEAMRKPVPPGQPVTKVVAWNVAGLRAILKRHPDFLTKLIAEEHPDVICLQETKISDKHVDELKQEMGLPEDWTSTFACSQRKQGYSGVATLSRAAPVQTTLGLGAEEHDQEGRVIVSEFKDVYIVNAYVPNSSEGLKRLPERVRKETGWDATLSRKVKELGEHKPVVLVGDMNCAHEEIDIHNPKANKRSAGFTQEERDSFGARYLAPVEQGGAGMVDTHRAQFPDVVIYTYFSWRSNARAKGIGWRLDYCLVTQALHDRVHDAWVKMDAEGSDHLPTGVTLLGALLD